MRPRPRLLTPAFALICAATLLYFASVMMTIPVFPAFLRERTGAGDAVVGIFIGLFSITGVLMRPVVGFALERHRRRRFMGIGGAVAATASVGYLAAGSLLTLVPIRLYHGLALASFYPSAATLVADVSPEERRGEAISYFSMFLYLGLAAGPALGLALERAGGFGLVFGVSAGLGAACLGVTRLIAEDPPRPDPAAPPRRLIHPKAVFPAGVLAFAAVAYGAAMNFTADMAGSIGLDGAAVYFPVLAGTVILTRFFSGRAADRYGRIVVAAPGLAVFAVAMLVEASSQSLAPLLASAVLFGVGFGSFFPAMMAFTIDRVRPSERGSAMGTFTAAFDVGFGLGSPVMGAVIGAAGYAAMYRSAAAFVGAGLALLLLGTVRAPRVRVAGETGGTG